MEKEDFLSVLIYILMGTVVLLTGFLIIRPAMESGYLFNEFGTNLLFLFIALVVSVLANAILLELGHFIGAKMGKYRILTFNIFGFCFYKVKEGEKIKTKFKMAKPNGFIGSTEIAPKSEKSNPMPYVFTPLLLMLLEFVGLYCAYAFIKDVSDDAKVMMMAVKYGTVVLATIGACFIVYNYFPAKLDSLNDGYRILLLNKKINIEAYNYGLSNNEVEYYGGKVEEIRIFDEITDFTANVNFSATLKEIIAKDFEKAREIIDKTISDKTKMASSTYRRFVVLSVFLDYLTKSEEEATNIYKEKIVGTDVADTVRNCKTYDGMRLYIAYVGISEKSINEIKYALEKKAKLDKREENAEIEKQNQLVNIILDKVSEILPQASELKL